MAIPEALRRSRRRARALGVGLAGVTAAALAPDGLTYGFKLRPNVKWHDGQDFTSADVKYPLLQGGPGDPERRPALPRPLRGAGRGRGHQEAQRAVAVLGLPRPLGGRLDRPV